MSTNIILCGVGGQGTILASKLIASAAMESNVPVKTAETIGMAQRGGSVFSHVRLGMGVASPLMARGSADLIIAFEPAEAVRQLPFLKPDGCVVVSARPVVPVSAMTGGPAYDYEGSRLVAAMNFRDRVDMAFTLKQAGLAGNYEVLRDGTLTGAQHSAAALARGVSLVAPAAKTTVFVFRRVR